MTVLHLLLCVRFSQGVLWGLTPSPLQRTCFAFGQSTSTRPDDCAVTRVQVCVSMAWFGSMTALRWCLVVLPLRSKAGQLICLIHCRARGYSYPKWK